MLTFHQKLVEIQALCANATFLALFHLTDVRESVMRDDHDLRSMADVVEWLMEQMSDCEYRICHTGAWMQEDDKAKENKQLQEHLEGLMELVCYIQDLGERRTRAAIESGTSGLTEGQLQSLLETFTQNEMPGGVYPSDCPFSIMGMGDDGNLWDYEKDKERLQAEIEVKLERFSDERQDSIRAVFKKMDEFGEDVEAAGEEQILPDPGTEPEEQLDPDEQ